MNEEAASLPEQLRQQGYFMQNFIKRVTEEEFAFDEEVIGGREVELEKVMTPEKTYNDKRYNVSYDELTTGFGTEQRI